MPLSRISSPRIVRLPAFRCFASAWAAYIRPFDRFSALLVAGSNALTGNISTAMR